MVFTRICHLSIGNFSETILKKPIGGYSDFHTVDLSNYVFSYKDLVFMMPY